MSKCALIVVDMQMGLFHGPDKPYAAAQVLANINLLIDKARLAGAPVFAVRHTGPSGSPIEPGSPLTQLIPDLNINASADNVFDKTRPNCFAGTELAAWLQSAHIDQLFITGMKTEFCIDTTCRAAAELGFHPVLVSDAHTTVDSPVLSADVIIAHHNRTLNGPFVKLMSAGECEF